jgi:hypothetical protein
VNPVQGAIGLHDRDRLNKADSSGSGFIDHSFPKQSKVMAFLQRDVLCLAVCLLLLSSLATAFTSTPFGMVRPLGSIGGSITNVNKPSTPPLTMTGDGEDATPSTFREAEVLGLKLMQQGKYEDALKGTTALTRVFCERASLSSHLPGSFCNNVPCFTRLVFGLSQPFKLG